tara:strand:+ start:907 stop:1221 length:315 start_codon:yes stop_codon:yes gene_type:complete
MARNKPLKGMLTAASPIKNTLGKLTKGLYDKQPTHPSISESIPIKPRNPRVRTFASWFKTPETPSNKDQIIKPAKGFGGKAIASLGLSPTTKDIRKRVYKKYKK